jgi:hypothetical protein
MKRKGYERNRRSSLNIPLTDLDGVQREGQIIGCHRETLLGSGELSSEREAGSHFLFPMDDGVPSGRREVTATSQSRRRANTVGAHGGGGLGRVVYGE